MMLHACQPQFQAHPRKENMHLIQILRVMMAKERVTRSISTEDPAMITTTVMVEGIVVVHTPAMIQMRIGPVTNIVEKCVTTRSPECHIFFAYNCTFPVICVFCIFESNFHNHILPSCTYM